MVKKRCQITIIVENVFCYVYNAEPCKIGSFYPGASMAVMERKCTALPDDRISILHIGYVPGEKQKTRFWVQPE